VTRRRYVYREVAPGKVEAFEVGSDYSDAPRSTGDLGKFDYNNLRMTDGADVSSRSKYMSYLKATGYAPLHEFKETNAKAAKEREAKANGTADRAERRETIGRTLHALRNGRKP
jgi:hypothetical protein